MKSSKRMVAFPSIALACVTLVGCPVNPATGERQLIMISESQEIQMGQQVAEQVEVSYGLYDDPPLAAYVNEVGQKLAATSERPNLPWSFKVVDDPIINAFALPGGPIFVTRGILAYFNSEAEMAAVLGHEIGHVTARHSAEQMSRAQLAGAGLELGAVLSSDIARYRGVLGTGLGLMFLKFGRDDERQSDDLGFRYMGNAGYDRSEAVDVFTMLDRVSGESGGGLPGWLSTHPNPGERVERMRQQLAESGASGGTVGRDRYLQHIDGIVFGQNPREGYFEDMLFLHPDLAFQFRFPSGWKTQNTKAYVAGVNEAGDAAIELRLAEESTPEAAMDAFLANQGIEPRSSRSATPVNGLPATWADFQAQTQEALLAGIAVFIQYDGRVYRILAYTVSDKFSTQEGTFRGALSSFDRLTDPTALNVQPQRLELVRISQSMSIEGFAQQYPSAVPVETLAIINAVQAGATIPAGTTLKRVVGGSDGG